MSARDGGPAFPGSGEYLDAQDEERTPEPGMSLRDYFAAQAVVGSAGRYNHDAAMARQAYQIADAMLSARDPETPVAPEVASHVPMLLREVKKCRNVLESVSRTLGQTDEYGNQRIPSVVPIEQRLESIADILTRIDGDGADGDEAGDAEGGAP